MSKEPALKQTAKNTFSRQSPTPSAGEQRLLTGGLSPTFTPTYLLQLQRSLGNQAVQRLVSRPVLQRQAKAAESEASRDPSNSDQPEVDVQYVDISPEVESAVQGNPAAAQAVSQLSAPQPSESQTEDRTGQIQRAPALSQLAAPRSTLQRQASGQTSSAQPGKPLNIAFVMGKDKSDDPYKQFFKSAMVFFVSQLPDVSVVNLDAYRSLEAIFDALRRINRPIGDLYIITHSAPDGSLVFPLRTGDRKNRVLNYAALKKALSDSQAMFRLPTGIITRQTRIIIKGCNAGRSQRMLDLLDTAFGKAGTVYAPKHLQSFDYEVKAKKGRITEIKAAEWFSPYFIEFPGDVKLSPAQQKAAFQAKYDQLNFNTKQWKKLFAAGIKRYLEAGTKVLWSGDPLPKTETQVLALGRQRLKSKNFYPRKITAAEENRVSDVQHDVVGGTSTVPGNRHRYTVENKRHRAEVFTVEEPTDDAKMLRNLQNSLGRPEAYVLKTKRYKNAGKLIIILIFSRTEYRIGRKIRDKAGKLFLPPTSDPDFYGASTVE